MNRVHLIIEIGRVKLSKMFHGEIRSRSGISPFLVILGV